MAKQKQADFSQGSGEVLSTSGKVIRGICSLIMILYSCITIFVLVVTVMDSLKAKGDLVTNFVGLPKAVSLSSYASVLIDGDFLLYFKNSLVLTVCGTVGCILLSSMAAYGIARYQFKGKSLLTGYFMVGMMVPVQVSILPLFIISRSFFADSSYMLSFSVLCSCVCSRLISPSVSSWHKQDNTLMHQSPGHIQRRTPYNF